MLGDGAIQDATGCAMYREASLENKISWYRRLQLLADNFNDLFAFYHGMSHGLMTAFTVMCVYGFVRNGGLMAALPAYLDIWCFLPHFQFMNNFAEIHRGSRAVLLSLRMYWHSRVGRRNAFKIGKELRSLKELRIKGGSSAFNYDKQLVVTVIDAILKQSVSLLMFN